MEPNNSQNRFKVFAIVSGFVFEVVVVIGVLFFIGRFIDNLIHTSVIFTILFMLLGVFYSIYHLIKRVNKVEDADGK